MQRVNWIAATTDGGAPVSVRVAARRADAVTDFGDARLWSETKLPKRLDLARDAERAMDGVPGLIVANWVEGQLG